MASLWMAVAITVFGSGAGDVRTVPIGVYDREECRAALARVVLETGVTDGLSGRMVLSRHLECVELPEDLFGREAVAAIEQGALDGEIQVIPGGS